ncbi:MAG: hypothetical protein WA414_20285 [Acidobacteriaceae bacterium]
MTPHHQTVMVPGQLRGMGRAASCTVCAVKVALLGTGTYEYVRPIVSGAPSDMPNGSYMLTFAGRSTGVQLHNGAWMTGICAA